MSVLRCPDCSAPMTDANRCVRCGWYALGHSRQETALASARRDLSEAIRLLRKVDRVSRVAVVCPECHAAEVEHAKDCSVAALLAKYPEAG